MNMQATQQLILSLSLFWLLLILMQPLLAEECAISTRDLQQQLAEQGYQPGPVDGFWGRKTRAALRQFQKDQGLPSTGHLDAATRQRLCTPPEDPPLIEPNIFIESQILTIPIDTRPPVVEPRSTSKIATPSSEKETKTKIQPVVKSSVAIIPDMVHIRGGCLDWAVSGKKRYCVNDFALGKYEVTFAEYDRFARATGRTLPDDAGWGRGQRPVINVSWLDAAAYSAWLARETGNPYRLPTETEWEYVARANQDQRYPWGNEVGINQALCRTCSGRIVLGGTAPVGQYPANLFGIHDLGGNVWEWTCSPFRAKPLFFGLATNAKPLLSEEGNRCTKPAKADAWVMRGGSWFNLPAQLDNDYRTGQPDEYRYQTVGFRIAR